MQNKINEQRQMHRVNVTVSEPDHTMVSKRKDQVQKIVTVRADSREHALSKATQYYKDRGYKVHGQEYIGLKEEVEELDEMDKSQPSSSRGAEGLPLGKKADPVKTDKVKSDSLKVLQKQYKKVNESSYNDDDNYAIHPETGKVMDSWSKRDSRVNAVSTQQHKDKGHIIKTGRELNYAEYAKSKNEMTNISQAINLLIKEHTANISEKLNLAKADMGDVIKDFQTSDAPQFQGKSKEKRRQMAIAAKLGADRGARNEETEDEYEYDREGDMAKTDLRSIIANAQRVHDMLEDDSNLPEWVQSKITLAEDYISTVANYMSAEKEE